jgi:hypothetical protein
MIAVSDLAMASIALGVLMMHKLGCSRMVRDLRNRAYPLLQQQQEGQLVVWKRV